MFLHDSCVTAELGIAAERPRKTALTCKGISSWVLLRIQVDFLPAKALDREAMQAEQARLDGIRKATRTVSTVVDGQQREFLLFFTKTYKTNGGFMFDVRVRPSACGRLC